MASRVYQMKVQDIVTKVRYLTQDETAPYRNQDAEIIHWLNDAIRTVVALVPQLFTSIGTHVCAAGFRQTLSAPRAHSLVDVIGVPAADLQTLTSFAPRWQATQSGPIENWIQPASEPLSFYCYPPSPEGQELLVMFVEAPAALAALSDVVPLPETYEPALVSYCTSMVEMKDDESADTARAQQSMADFVGRIKGG